MRLLIAEDEADLLRAMVAILSHQGYDISTAANGLEAVKKAEHETYDCMVFDIMMPKMDGIEALKKIRETGDLTPVIMLTAKAEIDDRVEGLDAGADDYLTKPFAIKELLARIRSLTRRNTSFHPSKLTFGTLQLDTEHQELSAHNSISLSGKETKLMEYLMLNPGKDLSTENIYSRIWKDQEEAEDIVWVYISFLRQKLKAVGTDIVIEGEKGSSFLLKEK